MAREPLGGNPIRRIDLFAYALTYIGGELKMSGGRAFTSLSSTVARVETADDCVGYGETCPLGSTYLAAHSAGARAALGEIAPHLIGLDAGNPVAVYRAMDEALRGHAYAKSAIDIACWDILGQLTARPVCDLLGGRQQETFALYATVSLDTPERMRDNVSRFRAEGIKRFQIKVGTDPRSDAARVHAVTGVLDDDDVLCVDANGGWSLADAISTVKLLEDIPALLLEQPCRTYEECLRVRMHTALPMILDEVIVGLGDLVRAWNDRALEGINLKIGRVGGLTPARMIRDAAQQLGLIVNIEDAWGGDVTSAAISHLAASTAPGTARLVSFTNDWVNEHIAGHEPRSSAGRGAAPLRPGIGVSVDESLLGTAFASFGA
jgi:L-alanine-DL-glutamate epimerase-like enolase superfamily enzyme